MTERPCIVEGCPETTTRSRCAKHEREANDAHMAQPQRAPYRTGRWAAVRRMVLRRDGYRCTVIENARRCTARVGLHVHHLVAIVDGGDPFDPANLRTVCATHHRLIEARVCS